MKKMRKSISDTSLVALFLQQALQDGQADFKASINKSNFLHWDAVIITASNTLQAEGYRRQIEYRKSNRCLPSSTEFIIVPDEGNQRVGSAGSTLSVIRELKKRYGDFSGKRFLCIHAGGDSKRCPQYGALGKLFSPIPTAFDGIPATLFDMFMVTMASMPGRMKDGMLLLSGDVILLFNALMCDFGSSDAAVISFKENVQTAKNHGVYLKSETGNVKKFLHKQSVETLKSQGAVDEKENCSIDTGTIQFSPALMDKLYSLVDTDEKYHALVNDRVRLSLYGDIAYCLAEDSTLSDFYHEAPEGEFCEELRNARTLLWHAISDYNMKLMQIAPAKFIHFGSIPEILRLMEAGVLEYADLGWKKQINSSIRNDDTAGYCSALSDRAVIGKGCYLETSYVHHGAKVGDGCYISFTDIHDEVIPDHAVVHSIKQMNGKFVCRIFGTGDNPKEDQFFGRKLDELISGIGADPGCIWADGVSHTLWDAMLYPECDTIQEAVAASLKAINILQGRTPAAEWLAAPRKSLCSSARDADPQALIDWSARMEDLVRMNELEKYILAQKPASEASRVLKNASKLTRVQELWLADRLSQLDMTKEADFSFALRLNYYLGTALEDDCYITSCFKLIADVVVSATLDSLAYNDQARIARDEVKVNLPLRVNWGGGWSDTPPHCLENGGTVINAAISLNGKLPVEVRLEKIPEYKVVFDSRDMDVHGEFTRIEQLQDVGDPFDPFALQKACLLACGVIPARGEDLEKILRRLGGGFVMHSEVVNVPKGSGLGTSSILAAATVKAMLEFIGTDYTENTLYSTVLAMEQIMSTGGGWQDQVGGVLPGIKLITSEPGIRQHLSVEHVSISEETKEELSRRFAIIYTGQRRLARNLLRDVVGRYLGNEPGSVPAHRQIQVCARQMRDALVKGDVDEFARLLDSHWELIRMIDIDSTNSLIDQIFMTIEDLIDARMICGAGGGGFLQVVLKKGVTKQQVHERLKEVFQDFPLDVWPSEIVY